MPDQFEKVIQFLVCPQNDFISKIPKGAKRPNKLHIGYHGSMKLRGDDSKGEPDFFVETVMRLFDEHIPENEKIYVVIDEDWHSLSCPEFKTFENHCVKGTEGAKLPGELEQFRRHRRTRVIRANSINVANSPGYSKILEELCGDTRPTNIRIGVFGVWTHIKVEYLLFNLHTLPPKFYFSQMAVCEPLCASPHRDAHNASIKKFKQDFKLKVFENIDDYCEEWLGLNPTNFTVRLNRHRESDEDNFTEAS